MSTQTENLALAENSVTALVIDGHDTTRIGVGVLLQRQPWIARCLLADSRARGVELLHRERCDVAVLDISDAGPWTESAVRSLKDAHPGVHVVLSSRCGGGLPGTLAKLGASGHLPAGASGPEIIAAIRAALLGDPPATDRPTVSVAVPPAPPPALASALTLTDREREVLELLAVGLTNREIAARLHLGPDSVKKHATGLYRKLGVSNRTQAARRAADLLSQPRLIQGRSR
ncbi:MAG: two component transcriptional regulator, LuxR family [Solirubrobacterales bacterium]|nr:two component transcriptional regulator, LuxR family [Solirubrobacterales bacterium]